MKQFASSVLAGLMFGIVFRLLLLIPTADLNIEVALLFTLLIASNGVIVWFFLKKHRLESALMKGQGVFNSRVCKTLKRHADELEKLNMATEYENDEIREFVN